QLHARAIAQKKLIDFLLPLNKTSYRVSTLQKDAECTVATIKTLIDKHILIEYTEEVYRDPYKHRTFEKTEPLSLTEEQAAAMTPILRTIDDRKQETFLLYGVTGSGKTEIYLQSIQKVLAKGQEAIVLVPEISLTPQMVQRFKSRFGDDVAVLHSGLS